MNCLSTIDMEVLLQGSHRNLSDLAILVETQLQWISSLGKDGFSTVYYMAQLLEIQVSNKNTLGSDPSILLEQLRERYPDLSVALPVSRLVFS